MIVSVVIPIGPGHFDASRTAKKSVRIAAERCPWVTVLMQPIDDTRGEMGRSRARNVGIANAEAQGAEWCFLLDADDVMHPAALASCDEIVATIPSLDAIFGAVTLDGHAVPDDRHPLTYADLFTYGPRGTLSMGCLVRTSVARAVPFDETLDAGEDFDWYLRVLRDRSWTKLAMALVSVRSNVPSATGPRGYERLDWYAACDAVIARHRALGDRAERLVS